MVGDDNRPDGWGGRPSILEPLIVTPTRGLKRLGLGFAAIAALGIAALAAVPLLIRAEAVRDAVKAEIRFVTGLDPILRGDATISLFPTGRASFSNVILSGEPVGSPALAAESVTTRLRFLPLLLGRIEVADVTLLRPKILISLSSAGRSNWSTLVDTLTRTLKPGIASERGMSFSEIRIVGGTVLVHDEGRGLAETLDGVELSLAWPSISKSFGATGQFVWRGEKIDASVSLGDFFSALKGERSGLKLRIAGSLLKAAFDGQLSHHPTLKVEGTLAADSPSLRNALQWAGLKPLPGGGLGPFALKAQTNVISNTVAFSGVNVELDGNSAEGVLTLIADGRPLLQGTLAAEEIDVAPYVSTVELLAANERNWSRAPIVLDGLTGFDMDLRLSAARIALSGTKVGRTAVAAGVRNGRFTVTIGESQAFGGVVKGSMAIAQAAAGADVNAQLQFTDVDLESAVATLFGVRRLEGRGNLALAIEASGGDVFALTRAVNGSATLTAARGALTGVDVEQLLRRLERRPLSGGGEFRSGRTPFDKLAITVKVADGTATAEDVQLEGGAIRLALGGSASIPARDLNLKGVATLVNVPVRDNATPFELPFVVRGRWEDPIMLPDVQSLIRRSGAAAPLLDAARGGRARDAVRSAIEQLTRGAEPPQVVAPPSTPAEPAASTQ
jgi:AsmA protein